MPHKKPTRGQRVKTNKKTKLKRVKPKKGSKK